jgi:N-acetylmuramoyl-L-alanine amidase
MSEDRSTSRRLFLRHCVGGAALGLTLLLPAELYAREVKHKAGKKSASKSEAPKAQPEQPPPPPPKILMIDPGHGGKDPGAIGRQGTFEKDVTLDIARRVTNSLARKKLVTPYLTREKDEFIALADRVSRAREAKADFFISIHADSAKEESAQGFSVYSLSEEGTDDFARDLAQQENLADRFGPIKFDQSDQDVANILLDLANRQTQNVAQRAKVSLVQGVGHEWPLLNNPIRAANFAVLRAPDVPSILIETGFLSNGRDETLLRIPQQREKIAGIIAREIAQILTAAG